MKTPNQEERGGGRLGTLIAAGNVGTKAMAVLPARSGAGGSDAVGLQRVRAFLPKDAAGLKVW
jgi:hypothetical protein